MRKVGLYELDLYADAALVWNNDNKHLWYPDRRIIYMFKDYINIIPFVLITYTIKNVCPKTFPIVKNLQKRDA